MKTYKSGKDLKKDYPWANVNFRAGDEVVYEGYRWYEREHIGILRCLFVEQTDFGMNVMAKIVRTEEHYVRCRGEIDWFYVEDLKKSTSEKQLLADEVGDLNDCLGSRGKRVKTQPRAL